MNRLEMPVAFVALVLVACQAEVRVDGATEDVERETVGVAVEAQGAQFECIDPCPGDVPHGTDSVSLVITSTSDRELEVAWEDWAFGDEVLAASAAPIVRERIALQAGEEARLRLSIPVESCNPNAEGERDLRILLRIDGALVELDTVAQLSIGYDC